MIHRVKSTKDDLDLFRESQKDKEKLDNQKWFSDDPKLLTSFLDELKEELGARERELRKGSKLQGGDAKIIDGPHEYAYNQLKQTSSQRFPKNPIMAPVHRYPAYNYPYVPPGPVNSADYDPYYAYYPQAPIIHSSSSKKEGFSVGNVDTRSYASNNSFHSMGNHYPIKSFHPPTNHIKYPEHSPYDIPNPPSQKSGSNKSQGGNSNSLNANSEKKKPSNIGKIRKIIDQKSSSVIYVKGLDHPDLTTQIVYGLFSNFGNIYRVLLLPKKATALIEYVDSEASSIAKEMLNNITFYDSLLKVEQVDDQVGFSNHQAFEESLSISDSDDKTSEVYMPSPKEYRFRETKRISINPPSKILHLSNIAKEIYTEAQIKSLFGGMAVRAK
jgi:hypothetical protein